MLLLTALVAVLAWPTLAQNNTNTADPPGTAAAVEGEAAAPAEAAEDVAIDPAVEDMVLDVKFMIDNLWILLAGCMVFLMHPGFACVESGLTRSKNTVNILFKNTMIVCIGLMTYALCGFNLMYPGFDEVVGIAGVLDIGAVSGFITVAGDQASQDANLTRAYADYTWYADFFFQAMFAATAATIVSGAVAGRIKLSSFLIFSAVFVGLCYPILGSWKWGEGWLHTRGFYDFAGSTLVHSVGGWGALVIAFLLGPRIGKYVNGKAKAIPGHSMPLAAVGVFLLWFGWFGFNGGSVLSADAKLVSLVMVTTAMAAAAGGFTAAMVSWVMDKKPDLSMALNGILGGLVGITAGADQMAVWEAVVIGVVAGVIVYFAVIGIDHFLKIDDPVGAISVHLVCGIWGTLAVGIFGAMAGVGQFFTQLLGVVAYAIPTVIFCFAVGYILKATIGLRVEEVEEQQGLDIGEHGMEAYSGFQTFSNV